MDRLGDTMSENVGFHERGGQCALDGCGEDAPFVMLWGRRVALPCAAHALDAVAAEDAAERERLANILLPQAGGTSRMRSWSLATYREACGDQAGLDALMVAERWLKTYYDTGATTNLILYGPIGSGKTGLAWSMIRDLCEHGVEAKYVNFRSLLEQMKDAFQQRVSVGRWLSPYFRAPVVCFDDLGAEKPTEWARDQLLGLVEARYERGLPTIYVSNYQLSRLGTMLARGDEIAGQRIVSRMSQNAVKYHVDHDDRRLS